MLLTGNGCHGYSIRPGDRRLGWAIGYTPAAMSPILSIATIVAVLLAVYLVVAMLAPERFG